MEDIKNNPVTFRERLEMGWSRVPFSKHAKFEKVLVDYLKKGYLA